MISSFASGDLLLSANRVNLLLCESSLDACRLAPQDIMKIGIKIDKNRRRREGGLYIRFI